MTFANWQCGKHWHFRIFWSKVVRIGRIAPSRRELARGIGSGELRGLSVAPDGKSCVTAGLDGSLWEWELPETSEASSDSTGGNTPQMLTNEAFQSDYLEKRKLMLRPTHVFLEVDPSTNLPLYAIDWGPAEGQDFIVHHGMSDLTLEQNEAQAVLQGYKRAEVKTVTKHWSVIILS